MSARGTIFVTRSVAAAPDRAWELIADTAAWPSWGPSVSAVEPPATIIARGTRGRVRTPIGLWLPFQITRCEAPWEWSWTVLGLPATTHTVAPGAGGCTVGIGVPLPAVAYLAICRVALARIAASLEQPSSG